MLAGGKQRIRASYQGINFFNPFFFLLVDSSLGSAAASFAVEGLSASASALPAAGGAAVELAELVGSAVELAPAVGAGVPVAVGLATGALVAGAGFTVVPGVFVSGDTEPGGCGVVAGCESGPVLIISAPTAVGWGSAPAGVVLASSGVTTSVPVSAGAPPPVAPLDNVNDGPCAPGRSTSVAETTSFGGFS